MPDKLAIEGGIPAKTTSEPAMLPGALEIGEAEKNAILEVLNDKVLFRYFSMPNRKSKVQEFEEQFSAHFGVKYALAVNSGTSSLIAGSSEQVLDQAMKLLYRHTPLLHRLPR